MPKRTDIHTILVIGSGPIVIGQACEFDYSGTQACKALRQEGYRVILVNSNPATIMTDPEMADRTYVEPLTVPVVERIIERERPDAILSTVGGQTGLNLSSDLAAQGVLARYGVELIGADWEAIRVAEDRQLFKEAMLEIGLEVPRSGVAHSVEEALAVAAQTGYPAIIRPSFTLGGSGGGIAYNVQEFREIVRHGLDLSPVHQVLVEASVIGWKEIELEVMRDVADNFVVICSIENLDPMGIHTGDSITVAPVQTLTDREYQRLRDMAARVIRRVGVETGGSNIQFAIHPTDGQVVVIEMNPRVSRSSALASKATGFPIAKIAAKLAVGYTLDEIPNDITRETPASFEPTIDYVVVKIPRWTFEKFPGAETTLGTQMKSVGEAMAIGRTFQEALQKGLRSLEIDRYGLGADGRDAVDPERLRERLIMPHPERIFYVRYAFQTGMSVEQVAALTHIDPWFLSQIEDLVHLEGRLRAFTPETLPVGLLRRAKRAGFSDAQLAYLCGAVGDPSPNPSPAWGGEARRRAGAGLGGGRPDAEHRDESPPTGAGLDEGGEAREVKAWSLPSAVRAELAMRARRKAMGVRAVYNLVDTCAAEFEAYTPYMYSTYESTCEANPSGRRKVMILGSGPNRIGQGIEFDYCCCHAAFALHDMGIETIMVNCNPETVSTDYDTSDRLYFEPLTLEDVLNIVDVEQPDGVVVQFGGQTPLKLARALEATGAPIWGTSPDSIDLAEDRGRFGALLEELGIPQPENGTAFSLADARAVAARIGYPVLVRPSYVLGGRAMAIVHDEHELEGYIHEAVRVTPDAPVLIDRFLEDAFEMDVDAVADGTDVVIGGIMEQIELAGVHSGDSACVIPTYMVAPAHIETMRRYTVALAKALDVRGLMNVQYAMRDDVVYVLEVNPRASRTVPFVSKATGVPLARIAAQVMAGRTLRELGLTAEPRVNGYWVKEVALPFVKFQGVDTLLGPEMKSTGEGMGVAESFGWAFAKAQIGVGGALPLEGAVFLSVNDNDKPTLVPIARALAEMGFRLMGTAGTARYLTAQGLPTEPVFKVNEGRPNAADHIVNGTIDLVINTPLGKASFFDEAALRRAAVAHGVPYTTTLSAAWAAVQAIRAMREGPVQVRSLQEWHE
ncbi:MAG: carbamoyl-phosphate synthase large subunit [Anaerolineae bacterium]|nr:carbamoyl-phosphate synthase large subunit [Anaerolineae bacterium]